MTNKQRVHAALEGKPVDRNPVTVLYNFLYIRDHFEELSCVPQSQVLRWLYAEPDEYLAIYKRIMQQAPLELLQPELAKSHRERANAEFIEIDGRSYLRDRQTGDLSLLDTISGFPVDYAANQIQFVFDRRDADERVKVVKAEEQVAGGALDYVEAVVRDLGPDQFVLSGGVIGTIYSCGAYVGQANALAMLRTDPELMDYLCHKILEQNIEHIRALASAGGDGIYIDDATATSDMISVKDFERFSLPYMKAMVDEIRRLGQKSIIIYFGGVTDRLDQIASIGADGLSVETSMKGYVNDLGEIARHIGRRVTLFGNLDPVRTLERASDEDLEHEMRQLAEAGRSARGFIMCTGSPITPGTPLARVRRFIELGQGLR